MALSLHVHIETPGAKATTKVLKFMSSATLEEVAREIVLKCNVSDSGTQEYGLFQPEVPSKSPSRWLLLDKTLENYSITSGSEIVFKPKRKSVKVRVLNDSIKTFVIDETQSVSSITDFIADKLAIPHPDEYGLRIDGRNDRKWLNPKITLHENGFIEDQVLQIKRRLYFYDDPVDRRDPARLHLLYTQAKSNIVKGVQPCKKEEAISLAAIQCQVDFGNYEPTLPALKNINLIEILPPTFAKNKKLASLIIKEFSTLQPASTEDAKFQYLQLCRSLVTYGISTFEVQIRLGSKGKRAKTEPAILGITKDSILFLDPETKETKKRFVLGHLKRWAVGARSFTLDFGDQDSEYLAILTLEADSISQILAGYVDIILNHRGGRTDTTRKSTAKPDAAQKAVEEVKEQRKRMDEIQMNTVSSREYLESQDQQDDFSGGAFEDNFVNEEDFLEIEELEMSDQAFEDLLLMPVDDESSRLFQNIDGYSKQFHQLAKDLSINATIQTATPDLANHQNDLAHNVRETLGLLVQLGKAASTDKNAVTQKLVELDGKVSLIGDLVLSIASFFPTVMLRDQPWNSIIHLGLSILENIQTTVITAKKLEEDAADIQQQMNLKLSQIGLRSVNFLLESFISSISQPAATTITEDNRYMMELINSSASVVESSTRILSDAIREAYPQDSTLTVMIDYSEKIGSATRFSSQTLSRLHGSSASLQQTVQTLVTSLKNSMVTIEKTLQKKPEETGGDRLSFVIQIDSSIAFVNDSCNQLISALALSFTEATDSISQLCRYFYTIQRNWVSMKSTTIHPQQMLENYTHATKAIGVAVNVLKSAADIDPQYKAQLLRQVAPIAGSTRELFEPIKQLKEAIGNPHNSPSVAQNILQRIATDSFAKYPAIEAFLELLKQPFSSYQLSRQTIDFVSTITNMLAASLSASSSAPTAASHQRRSQLISSASYAISASESAISSASQLLRDLNNTDLERSVVNCSQFLAKSGPVFLESVQSVIPQIDNFADRTRVLNSSDRLTQDLRFLSDLCAKTEALLQLDEFRSASSSGAGSSSIPEGTASVYTELLQLSKLIQQVSQDLSSTRPSPSSGTPSRASASTQAVSTGFVIDTSSSSLSEIVGQIVLATQLLVSAATDLQQEVISDQSSSQSKSATPYKRDSQWEEGYLVAAREVAMHTKELVHYCNQMSAGVRGSEEMLIACVRAVSSHSIQLMTSAKLKAPVSSIPNRQLAITVKQISEASQRLIDLIKSSVQTQRQQASSASSSSSSSSSSSAAAQKIRPSVAGARASELEEQARIARLEIELEAARSSLFQKRRADYSNS